MGYSYLYRISDIINMSIDLGAIFIGAMLGQAGIWAQLIVFAILIGLITTVMAAILGLPLLFAKFANRK